MRLLCGIVDLLPFKLFKEQLDPLPALGKDFRNPDRQAQFSEAAHHALVKCLPLPVEEHVIRSTQSR